ncbi:MAG: hypothetical protein Q8S02_02300 [Hydrogenophaga sp.]|nr:hypothetical protein [Hydrogenophaga sp.]
MNFVSDIHSGGRLLKYLAVADDFSHESVGIVMGFHAVDRYVTPVLDRAALFCRYPPHPHPGWRPMQ